MSQDVRWIRGGNNDAHLCRILKEIAGLVVIIMSLPFSSLEVGHYGDEKN